MVDNPGPGYRAHPEHNIELVPYEGLVVVEASGQPLASSNRAWVMRETGYPAVYYIPREDVKMQNLAPRGEQSYCPFKGYASYFGLPNGKEALAWSYEAPYDEIASVVRHLSFYPKRVDKYHVLPNSHVRLP